MEKISKIISNIVMAILIIAVLIFALPRLLGVHMFSVLSGSMEPAYQVGDLIYAVPTNAEEIEVGDVISFLLNEEGLIATHRVVEIDEANQHIYTKGDANEIRDGKPVHFNNVVGVVRFKIPMLGYATGFLSTMTGKIIAVTVILELVLISMILGKNDKEKTAKV